MKVAIVFGPLRVSRDFVDYPYFADLGAAQAAAVLVAVSLNRAKVQQKHPRLPANYCLIR